MVDTSNWGGLPDVKIDTAAAESLATGCEDAARVLRQQTTGRRSLTTTRLGGLRGPFSRRLREQPDHRERRRGGHRRPLDEIAGFVRYILSVVPAENTRRREAREWKIRHDKDKSELTFSDLGGDEDPPEGPTSPPPPQLGHLQRGTAREASARVRRRRRRRHLVGTTGEAAQLRDRDERRRSRRSRQARHAAGSQLRLHRRLRLGHRRSQPASTATASTRRCASTTSSTTRTRPGSTPSPRPSSRPGAGPGGDGGPDQRRARQPRCRRPGSASRASTSRRRRRGCTGSGRRPATPTTRSTPRPATSWSPSPTWPSPGAAPPWR